MLKVEQFGTATACLVSSDLFFFTYHSKGSLGFYFYFSVDATPPKICQNVHLAAHIFDSILHS